MSNKKESKDSLERFREYVRLRRIKDDLSHSLEEIQNELAEAEMAVSNSLLELGVNAMPIVVEEKKLRIIPVAAGFLITIEDSGKTEQQLRGELLRKLKRAYPESAEADTFRGLQPWQVGQSATVSATKRPEKTMQDACELLQQLELGELVGSRYDPQTFSGFIRRELDYLNELQNIPAASEQEQQERNAEREKISARIAALQTVFEIKPRTSISLRKGSTVERPSSRAAKTLEKL